jgi:uncharacterized protein YdbL (DUF1318 family)
MNPSIKPATLIRKVILVFCLMITSFSLSASPLSDARDAGLVSELPSGYVASTGQASADIIKLVEDVNSKRKAAYEKIAKKNGLTVEQVGQESYRVRHPD